MNRSCKLAMWLGVLASAAFASTGALAGEEDPEATAGRSPNVTTESPEEAAMAGLERAQMAARLAVEGTKRRSPILMLAAAEVLAHLKESERDDEGVQAEGRGAGQPTEFTIERLLAQAEKFAGDDEQMVKLVRQRAKQIQSRGLVWYQGKDLPTRYLQGVPFKVLNPGIVFIEANGWHRWTNVVFEGKKPAAVVVVGDGDGDLDLFVYDGNTGGLIGEDTDTSSVCLVEWTPRYEGPFTILVKNVGRIAENCVVLVNW
jgi:hypothetical protein